MFVTPAAFRAMFCAPFRITTVARPAALAGQLLVRVVASPVNPLDLKIHSGKGRAHHGEIMREATHLSERGKIAPKIDPRRFTLDTACDAYRAIDARDVDGKLVIGDA